MATLYRDRVRETSTTNGTGTLTLGGAVPTYQAFGSMPDGSCVPACIVHRTQDEWEAGIYTIGGSGTTLARTIVRAGSNGSSAVSFSAGTKDVFLDFPADFDRTNVVWVNEQASGGTGTAGDPWTGWDTAITWAASTEYRFPKGYYSYATSPNFLLTGLALVGESGTVLKYTGSGDAVTFTAGSDTWVFDVRMENFIIEGNSGADNGLVLQGVRGGYFKHIEIREFTESAFISRACVCNIFDNLYVPREAYVTTVPRNGILLDARAADGNQTTVWVFNNAVVEGASEKGVYIKNSFWNVFNGGTSEGLDGKGMVIDANGAGPIINDGNIFIGFDFEANGTEPNVEVRGNSNHFLNCNATGTFRIYPGKRHLVSGGGYESITIDSGVTSACLKSVELTGTLTDNGFATRKEGVITAASSGLPIVEQAPPNHPTVYNPSLSGGAYATNCQYGNFFYFVATDNFTLSNPTNMSSGMEVTWRIQQDATGSRLMTLGSAFRSGPFTVTLSTVALRVDYLFARYNAQDAKWDITNFVKGYA